MGFGRLKRTSAGRGWSSLGPSPSFSPSRSPGLPRCPAVLPGPRCRLHQRPAGLSRKRCRRPAGSGSENSWGSSVRSRAAQPAAASPCPESGSPCALPTHLQPPGAPPAARASRRDTWRPGEGGSDGGSTSGSTSGSAEASGSTSGSAGPAPRRREGERERAAPRLGPRGFLPAPGAAPFCKGEDGGSVGGVFPCPWFSAEPAESP